MNVRSYLKRTLALLLCVIMVVGLLPATAFATESNTVIDAAIFCSDVHGNPSTVTSVFNGIKNADSTFNPSTASFVGDTQCAASSVTSAAQAVYSDVQCFYAFGNHDDEGNYGIESVTKLIYGDSATNYYIYTISESSMSSSNPDTSGFAETVAGLDKTKPLFILSHMPLHERRNDNNGAAAWYDAISAAAEQMDIAFFWAHNHTGDNSVDRDAYYVAKDGSETITVEGGSTVTPNFTYANAGYIDPPNTPARNKVATAVRIYEDSINFTVYNSSGELSGTYAVNETVTREFAAKEEEVTLSSIAVTALPNKTEYTENETFDSTGLVVTATYSDNTTAAVTDYTLSAPDMTTAGTQTVTVTYGEKTATFDITVAEAAYVTAIAVTTLPTKTVYDIGDELDTTGMVVTATYSDGSAKAVTNWYQYGSVDMTTAGEKTVTIAYSDNGIIFKAEFTITVEEQAAADATLSKLEILSKPTKTEYLVSQALDITGMEVQATFSDGTVKTLSYKGLAEEGADTTYCYDITGFNMYKAAEKGQVVTVSYSYNGGDALTATFSINVWEENFTSDAGVSVAVTDDYGVTGVTVTESTNTNVEAAVADVLDAGYVAYDISLDFDEGYSSSNAIKTVTLPIPEGVEHPAVYYVSDDGATVTDMKATDNGDGTVSFVTDHFSTYVVGVTLPDGTQIETEGSDVTVDGTEDVTTTTYETESVTVYKLVEAPVVGKSYLIVNSNTGSGVGLNNSTSGYTVSAVSGDLYTNWTGDPNTSTRVADGTYTTTSSAYLWAVSGDTSAYTFTGTDGAVLGTEDGSTCTGQLSFDGQGMKTFTYTDNKLMFVDASSYGVTYNSYWRVSESATAVYFYEPIGTVTKVTANTTTIPGTEGGTYTATGTDVDDAVALDGQTVELNAALTFTTTSGTVSTPTGWTATYAVVEGKGNSAVIKSIDGNVATLSGTIGTAVIKVTYTSGDLVAWDEFIVTATAPDHYTINLHKQTTDSDGNPAAGEEITDTIALKDVQANETYSVWAVVKAYPTADSTEGIDLGDVEDDRIYWTVSDTSIATIDPATGVITFTGNKYGTITVTARYLSEDGKTLCEDSIVISVTESNYIVPGDGTDDFPEYPNEGAVRFDKTASAVGNFSETGIAKVELSMTGVPYSTGNELDVVLMLDMTGSMDDVTSSTSKPTGYVRVDASIAASKAFIESIVKNEDGSYNKNRIGVYVFNKDGAGTVLDFGTIDNDDEFYALVGKVGDSGEEFATDYTEGTLDTVWEDHGVSGGTPYDDGLAKCRSVLSDNKTEGRQQFCVFMTDGVPTSYAYVNGDTYGTHSSAGSVAGMLTSSDDYATRDTDYKYEYYSTEMKKDGVTVYSVGVGLFNENNAWSGTDTQCGNLASRLLNDISGPAKESSQPDAVGTSTLSKKDSYFFSVDDAEAGTKMTEIFSNIAQKIMEAATDVVVEDKVGNKYSLNFGLPGYGTDNALGADALDGLSEFYIQVVEYQLDANKERTGDPTVLENFTFNQDGTLKSHTVDGVACSGCTHVTTTNGKITAIDGTYFDYKSDSTGEYLTWEADKLTTTELALQYFAYLDNSSGVAEDDQIAAGTYYTNEYATLTYKNFQGNEVQQKFPVPQMTWNGAQVSYVFYLVNAAGQPVNRAGRVVPFAEAVYVTDVFTKAVVWNDLEQLASLDAAYEAGKLVPEVYALYDDDASYNIHVYEDQDKVNLNNHFKIGGDVTDDYNTVTNSWTNANTTYVFNNKSDAKKYNAVGTYATGTTYLCKGEGTVSGVTFTEASGVTTDSFANAVYYKLVDDIYVRELYFQEGQTYYTLTAASYTAASGETQVLASAMESTTGGTVINGYVYYVDEKGEVYTIVKKTDGTAVETGFDFSNTTVAFAVVWKPRLETDTVVIDYGLDVVVDVSKNDNLASGVVGVRAQAPAGVLINQGEYTAAKAKTADVYLNDGTTVIGKATVENLTSVRFSLDKDKGMQMKEAATFYYESDCNFYAGDVLKTTSMYSSVIVIPATTVYYEDEYVDLKTFTKDTEDTDGDGNTTEYIEKPGWDTNSVAATATQAADRPGFDMISETYDANNPYGYDAAYSNMSQYSMGSAAMTNVCSGKYATAEFEFYGTGFDVISMTSNKTGVIFVEVTDAAGNQVRYNMVDTYYGYTYADGKWTETTSDNALYQIPVMTVSDLDYGKYQVKITASYNAQFDNNDTAAGYDFYLDAIRIYDPVAENTVVGKDGEGTDAKDVTIEDIYAEDNEGWPAYQELRDNLIAASDFANGTVNGIVFVDGVAETAQVADYVSYGPNNEVYLSAGQAIVFGLELNANVKSVQLGMKSVDGAAVNYVIADASTITAKTDLTGAETTALKTATDMYYDITSLKDKAIVIYNAGGGVLSLTNIKVTFSQKPTEALENVWSADYDEIAAIINNMNTEEEVFKHETGVSVSAASVTAGTSVTVTVTTDKSVGNVKVNGAAATKGATTEDGVTTWTATVATASGDVANGKTITVVTYDADGAEIETITEKVAVKSAPNAAAEQIRNTINNIIGNLRKWFGW